MMNTKTMSFVLGVAGIGIGLVNLIMCLLGGQAWYDSAWEWTAICSAPPVAFGVICSLIYAAIGIFVVVNRDRI